MAIGNLSFGFVDAYAELRVVFLAAPSLLRARPVWLYSSYVSSVQRMLAVCAAGRILNPKSARSQVIGAMTMGAGAGLMEALVIDKRYGLFVNRDLAGYEVPVHADIPHQDVVFLQETDPTSSPMKAKGVGELGLCGVRAAIANAIYHATGIRVRDYPVTLDKLMASTA